MSLLPYKFIDTLASLTPVNTRLTPGDPLSVIFNKIQGQLDAIREAAMGGSYNRVKYLDDQTSVGVVLIFTFPMEVEKVWAEFNDPSNPDSTVSGRVRVDGIDPDADTGTPLHVGQTQPISCKTTEVRMLIPSGCVGSVYGYYNL